MDAPSTRTAEDDAAAEESGDDNTSDFHVAQEELDECRELARRPLSRAIQEDVLSLLSPHLWIGLAALRRVPLDGAFRSLQCLMAPPVLYMFATSLVVPASNRLLESRAERRSSSSSILARVPSPRSLLLPYALSPWALYHAYRACRPIFTLSAQVLAFRTVFRSRVLDEAVVELGQRIRHSRARRYPLYDLYLPPPSVPSSSSSKSPETYVLFVPGAGVSPVSYSRPASMLSDAGMHVAVVNTEGTLRLSSHHVGYGTDKFRAIQLHALSQRQRPQHQPQCEEQAACLSPSKQDDDNARWVAVGHSMGCFTLSHLDWRELQLQRIAFWAISPLFVQDLADLSSGGGGSSHHSPALLIVQGSDDALNRMASSTNPDLERQFYAKLPDPSTPSLTTRVVEGGTHRGFASYESRLLPEPQSYADRDRQQRHAVDLTVPFLLADE